jgi:putative ATP-dependent endonuclease of the OLD family
MLQLVPAAYDLQAAERQSPTAAVVKAVLGEKGDAAGYDEDDRALFGAYHQRFKLGSKPAHHIAALAQLGDEELKGSMPEPIRRLTDLVAIRLDELPE